MERMPDSTSGMEIMSTGDQEHSGAIIQRFIWREQKYEGNKCKKNDYGKTHGGRN
jgi:hypothetical protein